MARGWPFPGLQAKTGMSWEGSPESPAQEAGRKPKKGTESRRKQGSWSPPSLLIHCGSMSVRLPFLVGKGAGRYIVLSREATW